MEKIIKIIIILALFSSCKIQKKYSGDYAYFYEFGQKTEGTVLIRSTYFEYTYKAPSKHFKLIDRMTLPKEVIYLGNSKPNTYVIQ